MGREWEEHGLHLRNRVMVKNDSPERVMVHIYHHRLEADMGHVCSSVYISFVSARTGNRSGCAAQWALQHHQQMENACRKDDACVDNLVPPYFPIASDEEE